MRPPRVSGRKPIMVNVTVSMPVALRDQLSEKARKDNRSLAWLIRTILSNIAETWGQNHGKV